MQSKKKSTNSSDTVEIFVLTCPQCGDKVWSRSRHDMRYCQCGQCYIDGGRDYCRVGFTNEQPQIDVRFVSRAHINNPFMDTMKGTTYA